MNFVLHGRVWYILSVVTEPVPGIKALRLQDISLAPYLSESGDFKLVLEERQPCFALLSKQATWDFWTGGSWPGLAAWEELLKIRWLG